MRTNRKRKQLHNKLLGTHAAGLALLALTVFAVCYIIDVQTTMYANKMKEGEKKLEQLDRDLKQEEARWGAMRRPEELTRYMRAHGIHMELPDPRQIVRVDKNPVPNSKSWLITYHPETKLAIQNGASVFDAVKVNKKSGGK